MNILILTGGESDEREISLKSGIAVAKAFTRLGYKSALVDTLRCPALEGFKFSDNADEVISSFKRVQEQEPVIPLDPLIFKLIMLSDRVFPAIHGGIGENGRLASILEALKTKYSGSSPEALFTSMDKLKSKLIYESASVLTPNFTVHTKASKRKAIPPSYPCVVKPINGGSSLGISIANNEAELDTAIKRAFSLCDTVLLEEKILGREFSVCVLCDKALSVTEIIPKNAFFDYDSKYIHGNAREITPAPLPKELYERAKRVALCAHKALGLKNFSRTDLILKKGTSLFYTLETNAIPGLTENSILPSASKIYGIDFDTLCQKML